jgi:hypothetical protein
MDETLFNVLAIAVALGFLFGSVKLTAFLEPRLNRWVDKTRKAIWKIKEYSVAIIEDEISATTPKGTTARIAISDMVRVLVVTNEGGLRPTMFGLSWKEKPARWSFRWRPKEKILF